MRILCVAGSYPWPAADGYRIRLANMVGALASLGEVDFLCADWAMDGSGDSPPPGVRVQRVAAPARRRADQTRRWVTSGLPRSIVGLDHGPAREALSALAVNPYDLVYLSHLESWCLARGVVDAPTIVDFDNLENLNLAAARRSTPRPDGLGAVASWQAQQVFDRIDERRFDRLQRACGEAVDAVTVCSELDVVRSGLLNAHAVPNGYELTWEPDPRPGPVTADATVTFVGLMSYPPNADAACWFATEVLPALRRSLSGCRFRIVGREEEGVRGLAGLDGVEVVGQVPSMRDELARADLMVVPIRFGAGTRLKVVEALANRIPLVTTSVGCEGIAVGDGRDCLVADDAEGFAAACVRALTDAAVRSRLVEGGASLFESTYRWSTIRARLVDLALTVTAG